MYVLVSRLFVRVCVNVFMCVGGSDVSLLGIFIIVIYVNINLDQAHFSRCVLYYIKQLLDINQLVYLVK